LSAAFPVHSRDELTPSEVSAYYGVRAPKIRQGSQQWRGPCPIHDGQDDNFAVEPDTGVWFCHSQCGRGGSVYDLEMALTNTDFPAAANEVRRIVGRPALCEVERGPELKWGLPGWSHDYLREKIENVELEKQWKHTALYPYFYPDGRFCYVKVRFTDKQNHKTFRQWAVTPKLGWATRKKAGANPLLYRWNAIAEADEIFFVNGEKAAGRGHEALGLCTTCLPDGEGTRRRNQWSCSPYRSGSTRRRAISATSPSREAAPNFVRPSSSGASVMGWRSLHRLWRSAWSACPFSD